MRRRGGRPLSRSVVFGCEAPGFAAPRNCVFALSSASDDFRPEQLFSRDGGDIGAARFKRPAYEDRARVAFADDAERVRVELLHNAFDQGKPRAAVGCDPFPDDDRSQGLAYLQAYGAVAERLDALDEEAFDRAVVVV